MRRLKAAGIHLCLSFLVIGTIVGLVFHFWFPHRLYLIAGLSQLFQTMLVIDLIAGPALTLVVYKQDNRLLRRDLTVIGIAQAAFLAYGLHTTWASRPVLLVGAIDRLTLIFANEITPADLREGRLPQARNLSWTGPRLVATQMPDNEAEREQLMFAAIAGGADIDRLPKYYVPYASAAPALLLRARPLDRRVADTDVQDTGRQRGQLRALPVTSSRGDATMLVDAATGEPLRVVPIAAF